MSADERAVTFTSGMRGLVPFARPVRGRLAVAALLALLATVLELVPYYAIYRSADAVVAGDATRADLLGWAGVAAAALVGRFVVLGASLGVSHVAAYDALYGLRIRLAERLARVPLGYFSRRRSGELKKLVADDVERLELFLAHGVPDVVAGTSAWIIVTVWLAVVDWRLALATAVVVPVAFACMSAGMRRASPRMAEYQESLARMNGAVVEFVRGLPVIKVFGVSERAVGEARASIEDYAREGRRFSLEWLPLGTAFYVLVAANVIVIVPVGLALYLSGAVDVSTLLLFFIVGIGYSLPLLRLFGLFGKFGHLASGGNLVRELLEAAELSRPARERQPVDATVELRDVAFAYDGRDVLQGVSLTARPGEVTALVGPSGAGKTTIARLVARFWDVREGCVEIGGVDVRGLTFEQLMRRVAFVFQDTFLFDDTVAANLRVGRSEASNAELEQAARIAHAHEFIVNLPHGYETRVGERGGRLSGGERQRIALARALLKDAPILVLDEATAFADPENEAKLQEAIEALIAGRTVLMVAHRLSTVAGADQILVVDGGRIVERGRHDELIELGGRYKRLWDDFTAAESVALGEAVHAATRG